MMSSELLAAVRQQISDTEKSFLQTIQAPGGTDRYQLDHAPVRADSVIVHLDGVDITNQVSVEEATGVLLFDIEVVPRKNQVIACTGMSTRFFTDSALQQICNEAFAMHINSRADIRGRRLTLATIADVEHAPLQILCAIQALYVLLTDAAYDIDINAPDGVMIPRSQRYRQLYELLLQLEGRYRDLSSMLGVGLYALEVTTIRRVSKRTGRLVPIFIEQEIGDHSRPKQLFYPPMLNGTQAPLVNISTYDWDIISGDPISAVLDFPFDLTGCVVENVIRPNMVGNTTYGTPPVREFTQTVVDAASGQIRLSLTGEQTRSLPYNSYWELQIMKPGETESHTKMGGIVRATNTELVRGDPDAVPIG